jgi:MMP 1-O-methyltransferase
MFRGAAKEAAARAGRTWLGQRLIHAAVLEDPAQERLSRVAGWPDSLQGYEDLAFLFSCNQLNHGIAALQFDEGALLHRLAREAGPGLLAEIGRFRGGSTLIMAAAMHEQAELWSYDLHVGAWGDPSPEVLDSELHNVLVRYDLAPRVKLIVGDSRTVELPPDPLRLLFIDGDHSYEAARDDYARWSRLVAPGGHLLFHDAVEPSGYGMHCPGLARLVAEIEREDAEFVRGPGSGSIALFTRRG